METELGRIAEDLRGVVSGDVLCDDPSRAVYATDASLFEVRPLAVVRPRTAQDVAATVRWAAEHGVSVHARGAGSSVCGGSLGRGIVIDCSRSMRRIFAVAGGGETVRVQPGVVAAALDERLASVRRRLGPDPANAAVTTIGGMIGRNSSGSQFPRFGSVAERIAAAQVVLADGTIVELEPVTGTPPADPRLAALATGLTEILDEHRAAIAKWQPAARASHGGYRLHSLRRDGTLDLPQVLAGAEGTLGIVTEVTLRTVPIDAAAAVGLLFFDSLDRAAETAVRLRALEPTACDLFDKRHLALARGARPAFETLIPAVAEAGLLVEFSAGDPRTCQARLDEATKLAQRARRSCIDVRRAEDAADAAFFWELSRNVVSTLHGVRASVRPVPFIEDIVVPPPALPAFLRRLQEVLKECQFTAMLFGHAVHGQLHVRPYADMHDPVERERLVAAAARVYEEVVEVGGTIGGEQGLGLSRSPFFGDLFPEFAAVCRQVKRLFDPAGVLNPGRIVAAEPQPGTPTWPFRSCVTTAAVDAPPDVGAAEQPAAQRTAVVLPVLGWSAERLGGEVDACNGCGGCRSQAAAVRMCPRFRENHAEEATPRAKANLVAAVLSGGLDPRATSLDAVRAIADTCFNCHRCRTECAAGVDIPALVMELKGAHYAANSTGLTPWLLSRVDTLSAWGGSLRPLANWAVGNPQARWLLEKATGIARGRKLPPFSGNQLLRWAVRHGITRPSRRSGPRVLYFLDTYARRHDPLLAQAFITVLERNGIGVFVDPRQVASGMPLVSEGDLEAARRLARTNVRVLADAVRLGYRIVCTEPSTVSCITHDYPLLVEDDDMDKVVAATCDATSYLWELHREGRLKLDLHPVNARILYHAPCHARSAADATPAEQLLRLIPGLTVQPAAAGCSGMAGTFGLSRENYRASLRVGLGLVTAMRGGGVEAGATECSACRIQMEQGTSKPAVHPVKLLAKSYGLLSGPAPEGLDGLLTAVSGRLTTT
jgi:FAD/FMN-containing dehydrogenase/Fe-S oxidoreductase